MHRTLSQIAWAAIGAVAFAASTPVWAHHSYAMFDQRKLVTLQGTVYTWEMGNPHAYLWLYVNDSSGKQQLWGLEGPSPMILLRNGLTKYSVKPGDKVTVLINPLSDGRNGGSLKQLTLADGRKIGGQQIPGAAGPPVPSAPTNSN